jgi:DNA-binding LacI/PurR family transcriptional regulator
MQALGFRVPEDVALVAVDNISPAFAIKPFLTVAITEHSLRRQ